MWSLSWKLPVKAPNGGNCSCHSSGTLARDVGGDATCWVRAQAPGCSAASVTPLLGAEGRPAEPPGDSGPTQTHESSSTAWEGVCFYLLIF